MTQNSYPYRRLLISVDMERYSRRDNEAQYRAQRTFQRVMREAAAELGLDRVRWSTQQGGDGELAIVPPDVPESLVVGELVSALDRLLARENRHRGADAGTRLRIAIHEGLVHLDGDNGFPGEAVVTVCRLVDAPELKATLKRYATANVALIVSHQIYRSVVVPYGKPRPDRFRRVEVRIPEKDFEDEAWIFIPDEDVTRDAAEPADSAPEPADSPPEPVQPPSGSQPGWTVQNFGEVTGRDMAFGNNNTINNL